MREINKIIIHCTATQEGKEVSVDTIRKWHTRKGWSDIGYHFLIGIDGSVHEGRPIKRQGAHTRGENRNSIGIAYVGGVEAKRNDKGKWVAKDTRTKDQKDNMYFLLCDLLLQYPDATIHGHNEFSSKACPSFDVQKEYSEFSKL